MCHVYRFGGLRASLCWASWAQPAARRWHDGILGSWLGAASFWWVAKFGDVRCLWPPAEGFKVSLADRVWVGKLREADPYQILDSLWQTRWGRTWLAWTWEEQALVNIPGMMDVDASILVDCSLNEVFERVLKELDRSRCWMRCCERPLSIWYQMSIQSDERSLNGSKLAQKEHLNSCWIKEWHCQPSWSSILWVHVCYILCVWPCN